MQQGVEMNNVCGKRKISNFVEPPLKKQKTTSLLNLCMNAEWNIIIDSVQDMIHVWDFEEINYEGNNSLQICCAKGSLNVLQHFMLFKNFKDFTNHHRFSYFTCLGEWTCKNIKMVI